MQFYGAVIIPEIVWCWQPFRMCTICLVTKGALQNGWVFKADNVLLMKEGYLYSSEHTKYNF